MTWLTWRQMRAQTLATAGVLAVAAAWLLHLAADIREAYRINVTECTTACDEAARIIADEFGMTLNLTGLLLIIGFAVFGAFWGAPLITRELENGTHRLVWNQSVTRKRWLTVKLAVAGGVGVALTAGVSLLFTWAAGPLDDIVDTRFTPLDFASRNLAPLGYAVLAFTLGLTIGLLIRKTLPAMALTLLVFLAFQLAMGGFARPHYDEPVTATIAMADANTKGLIDGLSLGPDGAHITGYSLPGAWVLSDEMPVTHGDGTAFTEEDAEACRDVGVPPDECLSRLDAAFDITYQPADRYWTFQWIELGITLTLSAILAGITLWRIPRGLN